MTDNHFLFRFELNQDWNLTFSENKKFHYPRVSAGNHSADQRARYMLCPQVGQQWHKINALWLFPFAKLPKCHLEPNISLKFYQLLLLVYNSQKNSRILYLSQILTVVWFWSKLPIWWQSQVSLWKLKSCLPLWKQNLQYQEMKPKGKVAHTSHVLDSKQVDGYMA